jgi:DNA-binding transcriptional regulator GbsR (MarR family)
VGQIYALIFIVAARLNADEIAETLEFSRSNVSMGLKELQSWRLVRLKHLPGEPARILRSAGRRVGRSSACWPRTAPPRDRADLVDAAHGAAGGAHREADRHAQERMRQMHELIDRLLAWFDDVQKLAPETAMQLMGMGATVTRVLELKDRMTGKSPKKDN